MGAFAKVELSVFSIRVYVNLASLVSYNYVEGLL